MRTSGWMATHALAQLNALSDEEFAEAHGLPRAERKCRDAQQGGCEGEVKVREGLPGSYFGSYCTAHYEARRDACEISNRAWHARRGR